MTRATAVTISAMPGGQDDLADRGAAGRVGLLAGLGGCRGRPREQRAQRAGPHGSMPHAIFLQKLPRVKLLAVMYPDGRSRNRATRHKAQGPARRREQQMLEAAERAFASRGFHGASVDAIAEASGITKPMIYAYFGSKEGLYRACMTRARERLFEALRDGVDPAAKPDQQLWHGLLAVFTFVEREHDSWAVLLGEVTAGTGPFASEGAEIRRELTVLIAELLSRAAQAEGMRRRRARARRADRPLADRRRRVAGRLVGRPPRGAGREGRAGPDELRLERPRRHHRGPHLDPAASPGGSPSRPARSAPACRRRARSRGPAAGGRGRAGRGGAGGGRPSRAAPRSRRARGPRGRR